MYCVFLGKAVQTVVPGQGSVGADELSANAITGQTALGATPADTDELLVSDAGALKRVDYSYIKTDLTGIPTGSAGAPSLAHAGDTDTGIYFATNQINFATAGNNRVELLSDGNLSIRQENLKFETAGKGVYLGTTTGAAAHLLDDYEEGTFTPTWASDVTVSVASGNYGQFVKVGNQVTVYFGAVLNATSPAYYQITNAPFQSNIPLGNAVGIGREYGHTGTSQIVYMSDNSTTVSIRKYDASATANAYLHCEITYPTD
jgi:hypothetical protein